jgi:hypothetical protein
MCVICVLCFIVVPLPPGKNPFAVKINNNSNNKSLAWNFLSNRTSIGFSSTVIFTAISYLVNYCIKVQRAFSCRCSTLMGPRKYAHVTFEVK